MKIDGKVAMVTGGASGLGRATVEKLVQRGASAVIVDLPNSEAEQVAKGLGDTVVFAPADVTSAEDITRAVEMAVETFDGLHILVNCAGIGWAGRVVNKQGDPLPLEQFETVVKVNLIGTFNVCRLAVRQMLQQAPEGEERGVVVNTASIAAFDGQIGQSAYSASKGGVVGLTLPLARDLAGSFIRVCTIAPGTFDTPMLAMLPQELRDKLASDIPHPRRLGDPSEYAALAAHIVENPMLNGEVIRLDGALRMPPK
ncbi:MAG: 3-hydroxyacyl-CoA dehydrogenase [Actinobacteria bacterium]|nr:3-hydroxyacyl-CoA dehydrogenase [Actinomycetota bacterium]